MSTLSRLLPCYRGRIFIDNVDISTMDPDNIRTKLNVVTQEPFLPGGTVRENLNPWSNHLLDSQITQALEQVGLWTNIILLGGLNAVLEDSSLSHGQKQLFCLARALLRNSSILILDEPTGR